MNYALRVSVVQAGRYAAEVLDRSGLLEDPLAQPVGEAAARDELHDHVRRPLVLAEVVDVEDVRMAHLSDGLRLVPEASGGIGVWRDRLQDLHRAGAFELRVVGAERVAHGTLPDEVLDLVLSELGSGSDRHGPRL